MLGAIAGGIAEAFYGGVPKDIAGRAMARLDDGLRKTVERFYETFGMTMPSQSSEASARSERTCLFQ